MVIRGQLRDEATGDARWVEVDSDNNVVLKTADGVTTLANLSSQFTVPLGGQFRLDTNNNEINGWGSVGPVDDSNTQQIGAVGDTTLSRNAGGIVFPFDVHLRRFYVWHRNNNADAQPWGWVIHRQVKTAASNTVSTTYVLDEVADNGGTGPRDYGNNTNQLADIDLTAVTAAQNIPAGEMIGLGVAAPTAGVNQRNVQIQGGYLLFERA